MSSAQPRYLPAIDIMPEVAQTEISDWPRPNESESVISTNAALEIGYREAGTGAFITGPPGDLFHGIPRGGAGISDFDLTSTYDLNDGCNPASIPRTNSNPGMTVSSSTISDPTTIRTEYTYPQWPNANTPTASEGDYTMSNRFEFLEFPVPCLFGFGGICSRRFLTSEDKGVWIRHVETHLPNGETPNIDTRCLFEGCSDYSYHGWNEFLSHVFVHFTSNPRVGTMMDIIPDVKLLDYCLHHEIIGLDTYHAYKNLQD